MGHSTTLNFAPAARLPELLKMFGCADVVAPLDPDAFGRRAGELISRNDGKIVRLKKRKNATPTAGKYRLRALQCEEVAAQTRDPYAKDMLTVVAREFMQAARQSEKSEKAAR
jgi:hypothetical protein